MNVNDQDRVLKSTNFVSKLTLYFTVIIASFFVIAILIISAKNNASHEFYKEDIKILRQELLNLPANLKIEGAGYIRTEFKYPTKSGYQKFIPRENRFAGFNVGDKVFIDPAKKMFEISEVVFYITDDYHISQTITVK